jgi:hypothetical protein
MTPTSDRDAAAELAQRIKASQVDPSKLDEAGRPPSDKPPGFAEALMSEAPAPVERTLSATDWDLISKALQHYATCGQRSPADP